MVMEDVDYFARAIAADDRALLIDESNQGAGWSTINDAVAGGGAFAVPTKPSLVVVDHDSPDSVSLDFICREVSWWGLTPVVVASGCDGHRHVFVDVEHE